MEALSEFFTDPLRLTLGAAALVVLLGIVFFGRSKSGSGTNTETLSKDQIKDALTRNDDENVVVKKGESNAKDINESLVSSLKPESNKVKTEITDEVDISADVPLTLLNQGFSARPTSERGMEEFDRATDAVEKMDQSQLEPIMEAYAKTPENASSDERELFIVLHVVALDDNTFAGSDIVRAMEKNHLVYGQYKIFHYPYPEDDNLSLFSVVNMLKPGFFEQENMNDLVTTGLSFFMRMPVIPGMHKDVFTTMLVTAQNVSRSLGGQLQDETHQPLTQSAVDKIKQSIREFDEQTISLEKQPH
ncbi:MAG: hypothetical protein OEZ43_21255 [Gammaproteobacteria bacterium]|nr:hypothetical protein [Gammaproteobacteria bacterium]